MATRCEDDARRWELSGSWDVVGGWVLRGESDGNEQEGEELCETYVVHKALIQGVSAFALLGGVICSNEFSEDIFIFRELGTNTRKRD